MSDVQLPQLPEKEYLGDDCSYGYDGESMQDYARAAVLADRQQRKPWPMEEQPDGTVTSVDPIDRQQRGGDVDERAAFHAWLRRRWPNATRPIDEQTAAGAYVFAENNMLWEAWQARAALADSRRSDVLR